MTIAEVSSAPRSRMPGFLTISSNMVVLRAQNKHSERFKVHHSEPWPELPLTFQNPGFRVRYAYSRAANTGRYAAALGIVPRPGPLDDPRERLLLELLEVRTASQKNGSLYWIGRGARPLGRFLVRVADAYHDVHEHCPALPKGDEPVSPRHGARVMLAEAVSIALGDGLRLLGETPRERI